MYTTAIGRTFLKEYNRRHQTDLDGKRFFGEVLFELIFNDEKYLMWVQNSPFVQGVGKNKPLSPAQRLEKLQAFHELVAQGRRDGSVALGFPASEDKEFATTSGMVTDIVLTIPDEDVYLSWIGAMLGVGVAGGYALLFDDPDITYKTFEGWAVYRKYLSDPTLTKLLPNKLTSWNGQWLTYAYDEEFADDFDFQTIQSDFFSISDGQIKVNTVPWSRLFFNLSNEFGGTGKTAWVYALGQTNKTVGFIPFEFKDGLFLVNVYNKLFIGGDFKVNKTDFESMFGRHIKRACELGSIGLQALRPQNLEKYFGDAKNIRFTSTDIARKKAESEEDFQNRKNKALDKFKGELITFQTYKTWLIAMISKNKQEVSDYTRDIAKALVEYRAGAKKLDRKTLIEKRLFATKHCLTSLKVSTSGYMPSYQ